MNSDRSRVVGRRESAVSRNADRQRNRGGQTDPVRVRAARAGLKHHRGTPPG